MKMSALSRVVGIALVAAVVCLTQGDSASSQAVTTGIGVDPLAILDLQIKPNILIVLDTSGSMRFPPDKKDADANHNLGGDDPMSKMYQAKDALKQVVTANASGFNFGFAQYGVRNSSKVLANGPSNENISRTADGNGYIGPLVYVSLDANADTWTGPTPNFFVPATSNAVDYTGATATAVYNSFRPFQQILGGNRRYLTSRLLRDNLRFSFNPATVPPTAVSIAAFVCPLPPVGLFPQDPNVDADPTRTDVRRPCFQLQSTGSGNPTATFFYTSGVFEIAGGATLCDAVAVLANVAPCATDNSQTVRGFLKPELPIDASCGDAAGIPCRMTPLIDSSTTGNNAARTFQYTNPAGATADTLEGVISAQGTPLAGVLASIKAGFPLPYFPNQVAGQRNVVLLVTDGDQSASCSPNDPVAQAATNYAAGIETLVIGFGVDFTNLNAIARAGSGNTLDAYTATNTQELVNKLNEALSQTSTAAEVSDSQTVTESVFEYGATAGIDPRDPATRYTKSIPLLMQSTFEVPGYLGHLNAFRNNSGASLQVWDAADRLCQRLTGFPARTTAPIQCDVPTGTGGQHPTAMGNWQNMKFSDLVGANSGAPDYIQTSGRLRRRIFTTARNGVFPYAYNSSNIAGATQQPSNAGPTLPLWPPSTSDPGVDPAQSGQSYPAGLLDTALGIATLDFATLQSTYGACKRSGTDTLPGNCANATRQTEIARKEAREMILAYVAGAQVVRDAAGNPRRDTASGGEILYKARTWFLADGTLSGPAMTAQPLQSEPSLGVPEFVLYRDGPRAANGTPRTAPAYQAMLGLGLRNPDLDSNSGSAATSKGDPRLKPVMSVVYYGANDMLHAFRAGPQCAIIGATTSCPSGFDTGGEELWGFVPYDQLSKMAQIMLQGQDRGNHKYVIANAIRFGDVFVPGTWTDPNNTTRTGRWRRILLFGRGMGGKYYTALDVTNPGVFTASVTTPGTTWESRTHPPLVLWNRGNPDTQDGTPGGTANTATNSPRAQAGSGSNLPADQGVADASAYGTMGLTWSIPALARVNPVNNYNHDFVIYMGSGYRTGAAGEGRSFYSVDPLTGDILTSVDVGTSSTTYIADNVVVASPAVFNKYQLSSPTSSIGNVGNPAAHTATRVYVGDLHGRLWKFLTDNPGSPIRVQDFGVDQPLANAVALLNYDGGTGEKPHVYVEAGNDRRVPGIGLVPPPPLFHLYGLEDNGSDTDTTADNATILFDFAMPERFRGTVQPATAFSDTGMARVFMVGTRFNPVSVTGNCRSSFDSILYAVSGQAGAAAYDVNGSGVVDTTDISTTIQNARVNAVSVSYGQVTVDQGLNAQSAPPPPAPPPQQTSGSNQQVFVQSVYAGGSPVCR